MLVYIIQGDRRLIDIAICGRNVASQREELRGSIKKVTNRVNNEKGVEEKKVSCGLSPGCFGGCGLLVLVKDGKIVGRRGNPQHPISQGRVCGKRFPHHVEWLEHPGQLMHPLKRAGERGENKWQKISWEQALDEIADKLKQIKTQYGAESLAMAEGIDRAGICGIRARFLNLFGNPGNVGSAGSLCHCNRIALDYALGGAALSIPMKPPKINCYAFLGLNYSESLPSRWPRLKERLKEENRPKVIVIDPRRTEVAEKSDIWLQIRPGTDAALMLAWINIIIEEGLYDKGFIDEWTFGFDQLKQRASEYTPERVAEITWIPAEKIRESARMYATQKPSFLHIGWAPDQIGLNGLRVAQARLCLHAITGNMAIQGMEKPTGPGPVIDGKMGIRDAMLQLEEKCSPELRKKQLASDRFKLMAWPAYEITGKLHKEVYGIPQSMSGHNLISYQPAIWHAILKGEPYPIKAMITWSYNPLITAPNTKTVYKALKSPNLELHVILEHFMTPTALLADYVLPAASNYERSRCTTMEDFSPTFTCGERAIEPMGERRPDYEFFRELAVRLGFGEYFPWKTYEELHNYRLEPLGITFEEAARERYEIGSSEPWTYETINPKTGKPTGFATPSRKFELYSNVLKELGYDPLPFYEEPAESYIRTPDVAKDFPLILNTGGTFTPQFESEHRQLGMGMREQNKDPLVEIHPDTAQELGITDGEWIHIETRRGVIKQKAKVTDGIHPKVVNVQHGWWFPEQSAQEPCLCGLWQSNANVLTMDDPEACDRLSGGGAVRALLCKVYKGQTP